MYDFFGSESSNLYIETTRNHKIAWKLHWSDTMPERVNSQSWEALYEVNAQYALFCNCLYWIIDILPYNYYGKLITLNDDLTFN